MSERHRELTTLRDHFRAILTEAVKQWHLRVGVVQTETGPEVEWVMHERVLMLAAINTARIGRGSPPASLADVERADRLVTDHCYWLDKFPLHCAELVFDRSVGPT